MTSKIANLFASAAIVVAVAGTAQAENVLNVASGGSQNMVDYVTDYLGPLFEEQNPGWEVNVVGTGPGNAGSQAILEKIKAQAGNEAWDTDVVVMTQLKSGEMVTEGLLQKYVGDIDTGQLATRDTSKTALGTDVEGYVMPMFHSQTAIAYNPDLVQNPPASFDELKTWTAENKGAFGYNGIKNGMSGVAFTAAWMYAYAGNTDQLMNGPYDPELKNSWDQALNDLKAFNENVTFTPGNAGTLDMMNRGEIVMGPVWVDMFYTWQADGRLNPNLKLLLPEPGMPGQPYYYAIPAKAENAEAARKFIALATSPEVQAEGIVKRFNWYPGIDAQHVESALDQETWNKLFTDVTPEDLAAKGKPFPLGPFFDDIREAYEQKVSN
ncbi:MULTISPECIES: extracellular solute-binding protein [unclassified Ruegeria]|uniref:extracellular solute-binding protein n=1 Tax=unclassified Ruegeria TaxID=2625375 RepID=UPI0014889322|nr:MULTISPECIES: extracellular solute-binding protein [unclassified Ruegeria]NOD64703.1 extracellular solute-binding protein [Ruegeria sp. HKCCD6109]NOD77783.1 extracellular solute-binding protein [Ruegeria sp. HKCCD4332]NOD88014.1 extracellular solute-binding protein [Ruegeria sp. HKCCD4318]NOE14862.1 extracellular solute-binding protein [Ruegeria sp. HKCCD4318-2]NOG11535.1 extracellular solute-binding protein [Ruegeria sp. HKCCD4315]